MTLKLSAEDLIEHLLQTSRFTPCATQILARHIATIEAENTALRELRTEDVAKFGFAASKETLVRLVQERDALKAENAALREMVFAFEQAEKRRRTGYPAGDAAMARIAKLEKALRHIEMNVEYDVAKAWTNQDRERFDWIWKWARAALAESGGV